ncbi:MAG: hypothetical protein ACKUBY_05570 [Candidatus Moraniibacteriota bacterium]|jgi:hypothetical protein
MPNANQKDSLTIPVRCGSGYIRVPETDRTREPYTDIRQPTGDKNKDTSQKQTVKI